MNWQKLKWPAIIGGASTVVWWALRNTIEEWVFSSLTDELKDNAWIVGEFLAWNWSPVVLGIAMFGGIWLFATFQTPPRDGERTKTRVDAKLQPRPVTVNFAGILWEHDGFHPVGGKPKVRATCPQHRAPLFFRRFPIPVDTRLPADTDVIGISGSLLCITEDGEHIVAIRGAATNPVSTPFGSLRTVAETMIEPKVRRSSI